MYIVYLRVLLFLKNAYLLKIVSRALVEEKFIILLRVHFKHT